MKRILIALSIAGIVVSANANKNDGLLKSAEAGNLKALKEAFVLHSKKDAADSEDIDISIGKSIIANPKNFLTALKAKRMKVKTLKSTLGNLGAEFVDDLNGQKIELEKRLRAIQSVDEESLRDVRTECETELKRQIAERSFIQNGV